MHSCRYLMTKADRCPDCRHVWTQHWTARGCFTFDCTCRRWLPAPPPRSYTIDAGELAQLRVMVHLGHRGVAAAEAVIATAPSGLLPDLRAHSDVREGYLALADLTRWVSVWAEHGRLPQPARRWLLGIPDVALPHRGSRSA